MKKENRNCLKNRKEGLEYCAQHFKTVYMKIPKKEEIKEENKEENKEEVKEENKKENKEKIKEEVKDKNKDEIKEDGEDENDEEINEEVKEENEEKIEEENKDDEDSESDDEDNSQDSKNNDGSDNGNNDNDESDNKETDSKNNNQKIIYTNELIWKSLSHIGYPNYEVSSYGNVRNSRDKKMLQPWTDLNGYLLVKLYNNKKSKNKRVHKLVAFGFLIRPSQNHSVDHINRIRTDNNILNLRYATRSEQMKNIKKI
jgi:hypothetical protein